MKDEPSLTTIYARFDRGEATTEETIKALREHERRNTSWLDRCLDRLLNALVG